MLKKFQTCTALGRRVDFVGNYERHECKIRIDVLKTEDVGVWSCEMESFVLGFARGTTQKETIRVEIQEKNNNDQQFPGIFCFQLNLYLTARLNLILYNPAIF